MSSTPTRGTHEMGSYAEGQTRRKRTEDLRRAVVEAARDYFDEPMSRSRLNTLEAAVRELDAWERELKEAYATELKVARKAQYVDHRKRGLCVRCSRKPKKRGESLCSRHARPPKRIPGQRVFYLCGKCAKPGHNTRTCQNFVEVTPGRALRELQ
jgi:hypothetical protein